MFLKLCAKIHKKINYPQKKLYPEPLPYAHTPHLQHITFPSKHNILILNLILNNLRKSPSRYPSTLFTNLRTINNQTPHKKVGNYI